MQISVGDARRMSRLSAGSPLVARRAFLRSSLVAGAAVAVSESPLFGRWVEAAHVAAPDLTHETLNGLVAFVVPGADPYSVAQGVSTLEPGGVEAETTDVLVATFDGSAPYVPSFSAIVASILNDLAVAVGAPPSGAFDSPFCRLSFSQKASVFQIMDSTEALKPLGSRLPALSAALSYSEAGVLDPQTRTLTGPPVGWSISQYSGVAEGRPEFRGYVGGHRAAENV
jgi:hypothetical protein